MQAPAQGRPLYDRPFQLYFTIISDCSTAALTQKHRDKHRPVASSKFDPVARGHPLCTQTRTEICNSLQSASNLTLQQEIVVYSSHSVADLLGQLQTQHLTMARQNNYEMYLLNNPKLKFRHCTSINLASFLISSPEDQSEAGHDCLFIMQETSVREELRDAPIEDSDMTLYIDRHASIGPQGERLSGYAIVDQDENSVETAAFESPYSAQQAELYIYCWERFKGEHIYRF